MNIRIRSEISILEAGGLARKRGRGIAFRKVWREYYMRIEGVPFGHVLNREVLHTRLLEVIVIRLVAFCL